MSNFTSAFDAVNACGLEKISLYDVQPGMRLRVYTDPEHTHLDYIEGIVFKPTELAIKMHPSWTLGIMVDYDNWYVLKLGSADLTGQPLPLSINYAYFKLEEK